MKKSLNVLPISFFTDLIGKRVTRKLTGRNIIPVCNDWVIDNAATAKQFCEMQKYGYEFTETPEAAKVEEPAAKVEEPAAKVEEPAAKVGEPAAKVEEPAAKVEEPAAKVEEPAAKVEEPAAKVEEPAATEDPTKTAAKAILNGK